MGLFTLEHSRGAYSADFVVYGSAVPLLAIYLLLGAPRAQAPQMAACVLAGLAGWSLIEYLLHRFVLHGVQPFQGWHAEHHQRPTALICAPTILSAMLIVTLVFVPALLVSTLWRACALTLGVLAGYLSYAVVHHATHHWRAEGAWLRERKRCHARHHHAGMPLCFGVTSGFWDHVFGSAVQPAPPAAPH
jgi:cyclopropane-fatty-acyl-phospholipid synthase